MSCTYCEKPAIYECCVCGEFLCAEHTRLRTLCSQHAKKTIVECKISKVSTPEERERIRQFVKCFWGEEEQLTFDRRFFVRELPAYAAKAAGETVGFIAYAMTDTAIVVVALGIVPEHQGSGLGKKLVRKVEDEARKLGKIKLLVSTSNDDLPALAFYQSMDFQIFKVKQNVVAEKHGAALKGICGIPVRDELRLRKTLG